METQILRVSKLKSLVELRKCGRHNARTAPVSNAIESKKNENILEGPSDLVPEFKRCTDGMTVRKNAVYAIEILATFSASAADRIDSEQFFRDSQRWVVTHFGGEKNLIQSALHRDEKTPHCHFVVVPVDGRNRLNCAHFVGSKLALRHCQNTFQSEVAKNYGLDRGKIGSKRRHIPSRQYFEAIQQTEGTFAAERHTARDYARAAISEKARKSMEENYAKNLNLRLARESTLQLKLNEMEGRAERAESALKNERDRIRELPLDRVMDGCGFTCIRENGSEKIYATDTGHVSINVRDQVFSCDWSARRGGRGAIDLAMLVRGLDFKDAIAWLKTIDPDLAVSSAVHDTMRRTQKLAKETRALTAEKQLAQQSAPGTETQIVAAKKYLVESRGLQPEIVHEAFETRMVSVNRYGSLVFHHRDPTTGKIIGAAIRGTKSQYHAFFGTKDGDFKLEPIVGTTDTNAVVVVESAIDALSLRQLGEARRIISVAGSSVPQRIFEAYNDITVAFDRDTAGELGYIRAREQIPRASKIRLLMPEQTDWNSMAKLITHARKITKKITLKMRTTLKNWNNYAQHNQSHKIENRPLSRNAIFGIRNFKNK